MRRAFRPAHPLAVVVAAICAALALWDICLVLTYSATGGPWDTLADPVEALATINAYEARIIRDGTISQIDPLITIDFDASAREAGECWTELRDEAIALGAIDEVPALDALIEESLSEFDPDRDLSALSPMSRWLQIAPSIFVLATMLFAVGWSIVLVGKRATESMVNRPSSLSMPVAGAWYGTATFLYAFIALDIVMVSVGIASVPESWFEVLGAGAMLLAIPVVVCVAWFFCVRPNGLMLDAFGFGSRISRMSVSGTIAMVMAIIGIDGIVLATLSTFYAHAPAAQVWWESLDERLLFGSSAAAVTTSLDAVVGAPIVEEIIFRGILFGGLYGRWGFWPAALGSSLVFASVHGYGFDGSLSVIITGVLLCWLYARTGRLWAPMLVHGFINGTVVLSQWSIREFASSQ